MAHFAELDQSNNVLRVIVVHNDEVPDEAAGVAFCHSLYGAETRWVQTSYNANFRAKYAAIGDRYDADADEFVSP